MPAVVAVNRRPGDTNEEVELVKRLALEAGAFGAETNEGFARGGSGAADLARAVVEACEQPNTFKLLYDDDEPIQDKIEAVAKRVYGASDVYFYPEAEKKLSQFTADGLGHFPVCMAKTHLSLSSDPTLLNAPEHFTLPGARHPRLHRRRLAGAAVRRHHADARARQDAGRAERRHRRRGANGRPVLTHGRCADLTGGRHRAGAAGVAGDRRAPGGRPAAAGARAGRDAGRLARDAAHRARPARGHGRDHAPPGVRHLRRQGGAPDRVPRGARGAAALLRARRAARRRADRARPRGRRAPARQPRWPRCSGSTRRRSRGRSRARSWPTASRWR